VVVVALLVVVVEVVVVVVALVLVAVGQVLVVEEPLGSQLEPGLVGCPDVRLELLVVVLSFDQVQLLDDQLFVGTCQQQGLSLRRIFRPRTLAEVLVKQPQDFLLLMRKEIMPIGLQQL
jgi:hypothetical protein